MFDLAGLVILAASTVGFAALISTDPVVIQKTYTPFFVEAQGYNGTLISKLLRERIRMIAREARTSRGDQFSVFNADASAIDVLAERLQIDRLVDALREFLHLNSYTLMPNLVHSPTGLRFIITGDPAQGQTIALANPLKLSIKGDTTNGELFFISVSKNDDIPSLINELAEKFIERVDPYLLTLYFFRKEYPQGVFTKTPALIEHSVRVLPTELREWPLLLWGRMEYRLGHYDAAITKYREALEISPQFAIAIARMGEALVAKGEIKLGLHKMMEAIEVVHHEILPRIQRHEIIPTIYALLGDTLMQYSADAEARKVYIRGLLFYPHSPVLKTSLGALYLKHGQFKTALDLLQSALVTHSDPTKVQKLLDQALLMEFAQTH